MSRCVASGRCSCISVCQCLLEACDDSAITVEGNGSRSTPYTICLDTADLCAQLQNDGCVLAALEVEDTNTIDMTLAGTGTIADPWIVSAEVILTPDADVPNPDAGPQGNLIEFGPTGIYVSCEDISDCVGSMVTNLLDSLTYDDAGNAVIVTISADPGNIITRSLNDGGLFAEGGVAVSDDLGNACATATELVFAPVAGQEDCVVVQVDDSGCPDEARIEVGLIIDPDPCNGLECRADGLFVQQPDPATPEVAAFSGPFDTGPINGAIAGFGDVVLTVQLDITNPSACRDMCVDLNPAAAINMFPPDAPGGLLTAFLTLEQVAVFPETAFSDMAGRAAPPQGPPNDNSDLNFRITSQPVNNYCITTLAPGETATFIQRMRVSTFGTVIANGRINQAFQSLRAVGRWA